MLRDYCANVVWDVASIIFDPGERHLLCIADVVSNEIWQLGIDHAISHRCIDAYQCFNNLLPLVKCQLD